MKGHVPVRKKLPRPVEITSRFMLAGDKSRYLENVLWRKIKQPRVCTKCHPAMVGTWHLRCISYDPSSDQLRLHNAMMRCLPFSAPKLDHFQTGMS